MEDVFGDVIIDRRRFKGNVAGDASTISLRNVASAALTRSKIGDNEAVGSFEGKGTVLFFNSIGSPSFAQGTLVVSRSTFKRNAGTHTLHSNGRKV